MVRETPKGDSSKVKQWLWNVAAKKLAKRAGRLLASWAIAYGLCEYGIMIDETLMTGAIYTGLRSASAALKMKWPAYFAWM